MIGKLEISQGKGRGLNRWKGRSLVSQRNGLMIEAPEHKESQVYSRGCRTRVAKEGPRGTYRKTSRREASESQCYTHVDLWGVQGREYTRKCVCACVVLKKSSN